MWTRDAEREKQFIQDGNTPLKRAARDNQVDVAKLLLAETARVARRWPVARRARRAARAQCGRNSHLQDLTLGPRRLCTRDSSSSATA